MAAPPFSGVVVAEIVEAEKHPQAEKLQVCKVRGSGGELLQIVCGAANARAGLKTALATVGAKLPGDKKITAAKLRGVESFGMLCSAKELGLADTLRGHRRIPGQRARGTRPARLPAARRRRCSSSTSRRIAATPCRCWESPVKWPRSEALGAAPRRGRAVHEGGAGVSRTPSP